MTETGSGNLPPGGRGQPGTGRIGTGDAHGGGSAASGPAVQLPAAPDDEADASEDSVARDILRCLPQNAEGEGLAKRLESLIVEKRALKRESDRRAHDFDTLFEMVREVSVRSLDAHRLELYLLRTLMGRFVVWKVDIFRRAESSRHLEYVKGRGLGPHRERAEEGLRISLDSAFAERLLAEEGVLQLREGDPDLEGMPEAKWLREIGLETMVPLVSREQAGEVSLEGFIGLGPRLGGRPFKQGDFPLLSMLGRMIGVSYRNELLFRRSVVDDLTQVFSRGYFDARLDEEICRRERYNKEGAALLMLDLDHFKEFNDRWGHQAGDTALRRVAAAARSCVRNSDLVARYGGEEFTVILVEIRNREDAMQAAERIRQAVRSRPVAEKKGKSLRISTSVGVAYYPEDACTAHDLIAAADAALYRAKALGRDRVCSAASVGGHTVGET
jgi:diguanylate cyclase (GGDEF)-like protein